MYIYYKYCNDVFQDNMYSTHFINVNVIRTCTHVHTTTYTGIRTCTCTYNYATLQYIHVHIDG